MSRRQLAAAGLIGILAGTPAGAEVQHELLFFPSVDGFDTFSESDSSVEDSYTRAALDMLYSFSGNRFRLLGEFLWSSDEAEFERLQAGLRLQGDTFAYTVDGMTATLEYVDADVPTSTALIEWDTTTGAGSITVPEFNGGATACWDELFENAACP